MALEADIHDVLGALGVEHVGGWRRHSGGRRSGGGGQIVDMPTAMRTYGIPAEGLTWRHPTATTTGAVLYPVTLTQLARGSVAGNIFRPETP